MFFTHDNCNFQQTAALLKSLGKNCLIHKFSIRVCLASIASPSRKLNAIDTTALVQLIAVKKSQEPAFLLVLLWGEYQEF